MNARIELHERTLDALISRLASHGLAIADAAYADGCRETASPRVVCGDNAIVGTVIAGGCGDSIGWKDAYRCTDCGIYFHKGCIQRHWTQVITQEHVDGKVVSNPRLYTQDEVDAIRALDAPSQVKEAPTMTEAERCNPILEGAEHIATIVYDHKNHNVRIERPPQPSDAAERERVNLKMLLSRAFEYLVSGDAPTKLMSEISAALGRGSATSRTERR